MGVVEVWSDHGVLRLDELHKSRDAPGCQERRTRWGVAQMKLTRDRILDEAIAMALYRHVNGREDLLEGVVDRLVSTLQIDPGHSMEPLDGWQAFLQWMAHNVRRLALEHPNAFPLVATRHPAAPWLRPPLRSLRVVEEPEPEALTRSEELLTEIRDSLQRSGSADQQPAQ